MNRILMTIKTGIAVLPLSFIGVQYSTKQCLKRRGQKEFLNLAFTESLG